MNSIIKTVPNVKKFNDYLFEINKGTSPIMLSGLTDSAKVHMAYSTKFYSEKNICIITYNEMQAKKIMKDLEFFGEKIKFFPKRDVISFDYVAESKDILFKRISVLNKLVKNDKKIIVTTIEAAMQKMITKESLYKNVMKLKVGDNFNLEELKEKLVLLGYERYDLIEGKGQFSVRGGIVDIATSINSGVRIEFWGDEIDSIRKFSISTQRTVQMLEEIEIFPSFEFLLETDVDTVCEKIMDKVYPNSVKEKVQDDVYQIKNGEFLTKIDKYFDCFYEKTNTLLDYLQEDCIIFLDEISKIKARAENITKDNSNLIKDLVGKNKIVPGILTEMKDYFKFSESLENKQVIYLEKQDVGFILLISHILASLTVAYCFRFWKKDKFDINYRETKFNSKLTPMKISDIGEILGNSIKKAISSILLIGGFIVIFSVILSILQTSGILSICSEILYNFRNTKRSFFKYDFWNYRTYKWCKLDSTYCYI